MRGKRNLFAGIIITGLAGVVAVSLILNRGYQDQIREQQMQIDQQTGMIENMRQSSQGSLMGHLFDKIEEELKYRPDRTLSDKTITQIIGLSSSLKPYIRADRDSNSLKLLSPERGQLLLMLSGIAMDSTTIRTILSEVNFSNADLREADLRAAYLSGVNLSGADLQGADLRDADLSRANLAAANFWDANLQKANLSGSDLTSAVMSWADMNGADFKNAVLHEADFSSAQLRKADFREADMQWADFNGAFLNEANLTGANMFISDFKRANLEQAVMHDANLKLVNLSEANLAGADLTGADVTDVMFLDQDWFTRLDEWGVAGAAAIRQGYKIISESADGRSFFQLKPLAR